MNYQEVLKFVSVSFEVFPSKLKKFENSLKLPGVLFLISLIIYSVNGKTAIYLGYSDLNEFIVESCRQIVDNKVTFGVVSVNHSEGG